MPLPGLYPPFVTSVAGGGSGTVLTVVENLEVEYLLVSAYDVEYESISTIGP